MNRKTDQLQRIQVSGVTLPPVLLHLPIHEIVVRNVHIEQHPSHARDSARKAGTSTQKIKRSSSESGSDVVESDAFGSQFQVELLFQCLQRKDSAQRQGDERR